MPPRPQFRKVAEEFLEERDEYDEEEHGGPSGGFGGHGGLGGLGGLGGRSGGHSGLGGLGGLGGRSGGHSSSGLGGLGGLGNSAGGLSGLGGLGGLRINEGSGRGMGGLGGLGGMRSNDGDGGFGGRGGADMRAGAGGDTSSKGPAGRGFGGLGNKQLGGLGSKTLGSDKGITGLSAAQKKPPTFGKTAHADDASVRALEDVSNTQKEMMKAINEQVGVLKDLKFFLQGLTDKTYESFNAIANKLAAHTNDASGAHESLDTLAKHIDDQMLEYGHGKAYVIIPGSEYHVVALDALPEVIQGRTIHICSGIHSVAAAIHKAEQDEGEEEVEEVEGIEKDEKVEEKDED